jgi:hypothetical protein
MIPLCFIAGRLCGRKLLPGNVHSVVEQDRITAAANGDILSSPEKRSEKSGLSGEKMIQYKSKTAKMFLALMFTGMVLSDSGNLHAQNASRQIAVPLPPMGWSSWNSFSNTIDSDITLQQAKAMISTGMHKVGYQYVNIDEGWWLGERDKDGNIVVDPKAWPALSPGERASDMSNIVRAIHALGLKAGIYTDAGANGCSTLGPDIGPSYPNTGSEGHYEQDFLQFAKWGFDYVKVDWCGGDKEKLDPAIQYSEIARAIARAESITGHHLYYSICDWGVNSPWTWAPGIGGVMADIWRTSGDIVAPIVANSKNSDRMASFPGVLSNFDQGIHPEAQHTGFYNDPDMMVLGMQGLTDAQNRVHMSLWAISGAPLLVGADLTKLSDATRATLTNSAVLQIDQDALGLQAVKVSEPATGLEVWSKPLSKPGERAVLLFNRTGSAASIAVNWSDLGLLSISPATVKDLWTGKDLGAFDLSYSTAVPADDAVLFLIHGHEGKLTTYKAAASSKQASNVYAVTVLKDHPLTFTQVSSHARVARIQIAYTNPGRTTRMAELRVNGQIATRVAFPPTGNNTITGTVWIQSLLDRAGAYNVLSFSTSSVPGPAIESISLE